MNAADFAIGFVFGVTVFFAGWATGWWARGRRR